MSTPSARPSAGFPSTPLESGRDTLLGDCLSRTISGKCLPDGVGPAAAVAAAPATTEQGIAMILRTH